MAARALTTKSGKALGGGILQIDSPGKPVNIPVSVSAPGKYRIAVKLYDIGQAEPVTVGLQGGPAKTLEKVTSKKAAIDLGSIEVGKDQTFTIVAQSPAAFAIDLIKIEVE